MGSRCRILVLLSACILYLSSWVCAADVGRFYDDFDKPFDFLAQGRVGNSGWDGIMGLDTASDFSANIDQEGRLYMSSSDSYWDPDFDDYGPFLYKLVDGDFKATTYVGDFSGLVDEDDRVEHNDCFIMARDPEGDPDAENFETVNYFPTWIGVWGRDMEDSVETEWGSTADGFDCAQYIQLERVGNDFYFRYSEDGETWEELDGSPVTRDDLPNLLQVGVGQCTYSSNEGYAAFDYVEIYGVVDTNKPYNPNPAQDATDVDRDSSLNWYMGDSGDVDNLYFGTDSDAVSNGLADVLVGEAMPGVEDGEETKIEYTPDEMLEYGLTYYWRAEDVNQTTSTVISGELWSFTTEPYVYLVEDITATASTGNPAVTVNGAGLKNGLHSTAEEGIWSTFIADDAWLEYDLNEPVILSEMKVWNGNTAWEGILKMGINEVRVEYSLDGETWTVAEGITNFVQGPGAAGYACNNVIDMGNVEAQYVRIVPLSNFGVNAGYTLSEVQFYSLPVVARKPSPEDAYESTESDELATELVWRTGRTAVSQQLYLGTDANAVAEGTADMVEQTARRYQPEGLAYDQTYYWKVDQVTADGVIEGPVWSWTTPPYLLVDDFEDYGDTKNEVYYTWIDGYDIDDNGSLVGYDDETIMEETLVYNGKKSMPYEYGYDGATVSEATIDLGSQDWTKGDLTTLVFFVRGDQENEAGDLYVKINNSKVPCTANLTVALWTQVNVDLEASGANLSKVQSLTIGVEGGEGVMLVDTIRLYREADEPVPPVPPSTDGLVATYSFEQDLTDSFGNNDANSASTPFYNSKGVEGYALDFDGVFSAGIPLASKIAGMTDCTFSIWVSIDPDTDGAWMRAFDVGTSTTSYLYLCPRIGSNGEVRACIMPEGESETLVDSSGVLIDGWHHLAMTFGDGVFTLYVDGMATSVETELTPTDLGSPDHCYIGQSPFSGDDYYVGLMDEFNIYERCLSAGEIRYLAGDRP